MASAQLSGNVVYEINDVSRGPGPLLIVVLDARKCIFKSPLSMYSVQMRQRKGGMGSIVPGTLMRVPPAVAGVFSSYDQSGPGTEPIIDRSLEHFAFEIVRFQKRRAVISPEKRVFQAHSAQASAPAAAGAVAVFNSKPL